jgi:3-deoxy-D-manno-octulosonate 8-phosphate phosphatase (KDO 8-P phosphatase)
MIELLIFDVDGCMTDGKITYSSNNLNELKSFNVKDGLAISSWNRLNKKSAIITGRKSSIVERRAKELGITHLYQNIKNKKETLDKILKEESLSYDQVAIIGDDLNDFNMLSSVKESFCPNDASEYIKDICKTICTKNGGYGAVREMIENIIKKENLENEFLSLWK